MQLFAGASPEYMHSLRGTIPGAAISVSRWQFIFWHSPHIWTVDLGQLPNLVILIHTRLLFDTTPHF
jgi:hypothetical protein